MVDLKKQFCIHINLVCNKFLCNLICIIRYISHNSFIPSYDYHIYFIYQWSQFSGDYSAASVKVKSWPLSDPISCATQWLSHDPNISHAVKSISSHVQWHAMYPSFYWIRPTYRQVNTYPIDDDSIRILVRLQGMDGHGSKYLFITPLKISITYTFDWNSRLQ